MSKVNYTPEELKSNLKIKDILLQFIVDANVRDHEYDEDEPCCDDCCDEDEDCDYECSCHSFPGYDEYLSVLILRFINQNFVVKETPNE